MTRSLFRRVSLRRAIGPQASACDGFRQRFCAAATAIKLAHHSPAVPDNRSNDKPPIVGGDIAPSGAQGTLLEL